MAKLKYLKFCVNEKEYEELKREAAAKNMSVYALCKQRVLRNRYAPIAVYSLMVYAAGTTAFLIYLITAIMTHV